MIKVSAAAAHQLAKRSKHVLFSCRSGGCNGFEYSLEDMSAPPEDAEAQPLPNTTLHVCNMSMLYLLGTSIDWKEDIMGSRFVFENPVAVSTCGCGATFSPSPIAMPHHGS